MLLCVTQTELENNVASLLTWEVTKHLNNGSSHALCLIEHCNYHIVHIKRLIIDLLCVYSNSPLKYVDMYYCTKV